MVEEVATPIDLRSPADARKWARDVMAVRPYRVTFFEKILERICNEYISPFILELGSGPGYLANYLVENLSFSRYVAFDFSEAMHEIAKEMHPLLSNSIEFYLGDFKENSWNRNFENVDVIVSIQAIHELRHKEYAKDLFPEIKDSLSGNGVFLYCDHYSGEGGLKDQDLFMTDREKEKALKYAGFSHVNLIYKEGTLSLWKAGK